MKIIALTGFAGKESMAMGQVKDIPDPIALDLIKAGYAEKVEGDNNGKSKVSKTRKRKEQ